jgi:hypothetical protein
LPAKIDCKLCALELRAASNGRSFAPSIEVRQSWRGGQVRRHSQDRQSWGDQTQTQAQGTGGTLRVVAEGRRGCPCKLETILGRCFARGLTGAALASALLKEIAAAVAASPAVKRSKANVSAVAEHGGLHVGNLVYAEARPPAWLAASAAGSLEDVVHHLAVIAVAGDKAALVVSDSAMRDQMLAVITVATILDRSTVAEAFVGPDAKTVWLNGVHARTQVKADSKMLTGVALEYALDPLGDQTYSLAAIRSQPAVTGLLRGTRQAVVGVAPSASRVWLGRPCDWGGFIAQTGALLAHLGAPPRANSLYRFLSQAVTSAAGVKDAYALAVLPSALLAEDSVATPDQRGEAYRWSYEAVYAVTGSAGLDLDVRVEVGGADLGTVCLAVAIDARGRVTVTPTWTTPAPALNADRTACSAFLCDPYQLKIYYDSGHAIADGQCFRVGWTDQVFDWEFANLSGYKVQKEKPEVNKGEKLADKIGAAGDTSLFGFVQRKLFKTGWLACDDGAMELADFVHVDIVTNRITLIHVKGSGSEKDNRQVSVADYEVVVSQGVKNIRHLDRDRLAVALGKGNKKDIARAVWKDGVRQADRKGMIAAIKALPRLAPRELLILQPRLTEKEHKFCEPKDESNARALRFKQLNALMLAARISAMGTGAELRAIAAA